MTTEICPFCGKTVDKFIMFRGDIVGCRYCGIHTKQTNADRIRSMSDEELSEFIGKFCDCQLGDCPITTSPYNCSENGCKGSWLKWLKRKAEI